MQRLTRRSPRLPNLVDGEWRWSLFRHQRIFDMQDPTEVYLDRWRVDTPLLSVFLHAIRLPDRDPNPHTHPFSWSASLILKGGYVEHRGATGVRVRTLGPGSINMIKGNTIHRIDRTRNDKTVWTLFLAGKPHGRGWGFVVDGEYQDHKRYLAERDDAAS